MRTVFGPLFRVVVYHPATLPTQAATRAADGADRAATAFPADKRTAVFVANTDVSAATADVPGANTGAPAATADVLVATTGLPAANTGVFAARTGVPVATADVPAPNSAVAAVPAAAAGKKTLNPNAVTTRVAWLQATAWGGSSAPAQLPPAPLALAGYPPR